MSVSQYNVYPILTPVRLVTLVNVVGSYNNGPTNNGVGAFLTTASGTLTVDGVLVQNNDSLLLIFQTNTNENGIYTADTTGVGVVLTRRQDFQNIEQLKGGQTVAVSSGNTQAGGVYTLVDPLPGHFGIDPISFSTASGSGTGTAADKDATDNAQPTVASVVGATVVNQGAVFADTVGSIKNAGTVAVFPDQLDVGILGTSSGILSVHNSVNGSIHLGTVTNINGDVSDTIINNQGTSLNTLFELPFTSAGQSTNTIVGNNGPTTLNTNAYLTFGKANGTEAANAVTASAQSGIITTSALTTAAGASYTITWTNTFLSPTSSIHLMLGGGTNTVKNITMQASPGAGSSTVVIYNNDPAAALNGTLLINYFVA